MTRHIFSIIALVQDAILVFLFIKGLSVRSKRKDPDRNIRTVSLSSVLFWTGAVIAGIFSVPITVFRPNELSSDGAVWYVFEACIIVCIFLMLAYINQTIEYTDTEFEVRNIFGRKRVYSYDEITGITAIIVNYGTDRILYCGKKKVKIDALALGGDKFVTFADKLYMLRNNRGIPYRKRNRDPMNGNMANPWFFFIMYSLVFAFFIILAGLSVYRMLAQRDQIGACIVLLAFSILGGTFSIFGILVGRHPERYSARFCTLFLRAQFWTPGALKDDKKIKRKNNPKSSLPAAFSYKVFPLPRLFQKGRAGLGAEPQKAYSPSTISSTLSFVYLL